mmetsp:Transcript_7527/g.13972  ORF Transcript_7527/g.13972 Transcript_7527/m.13972 type:complete len:471 (+) Transcript_7527:40-1452(+)
MTSERKDGVKKRKIPKAPVGNVAQIRRKRAKYEQEKKIEKRSISVGSPAGNNENTKDTKKKSKSEKGKKKRTGVKRTKKKKRARESNHPDVHSTSHSQKSNPDIASRSNEETKKTDFSNSLTKEEKRARKREKRREKRKRRRLRINQAKKLEEVDNAQSGQAKLVDEKKRARKKEKWRAKQKRRKLRKKEREENAKVEENVATGSCNPGEAETQENTAEEKERLERKRQKKREKQKRKKDRDKHKRHEKSRKSAQTAYQDATAAVKSMFACIVCVDIEAWERNPKIITEIGVCVARVSCGQLISIDPMHICIKENAKKRNGRFVEDNRMHFKFGRTRWLSLEDATSQLKTTLAECTHFVGHAVGGDIRWLKSIGIKTAFTTFDTQVLKSTYHRNCPSLLCKSQILYQHRTGVYGQVSSLSKLVEAECGYEPTKLHNGGNDAHYTMNAFLAMLLVDTADCKKFSELLSRCK